MPQDPKQFVLNRRVPRITQAPPPLTATAEQAEQHKQAQQANAERRAQFLAQLNAMPPADLDALYAAERLAALHEMGLMLHPADFAPWITLDEWRVFEAAHLLHGFEPLPPDQFKVEDRNNLPHDCDRWKAADMYDRIKRACSSGALPHQPAYATHPYVRYDRLKPVDVVQWARGKRFPIPPDIDAAFPAPQPQPEQRKPAPLTPLDYSGLAKNFTYPAKKPRVGSTNLGRWKKACEDLPDGLIAARVTKGGPGRPSTFDPEKIAQWMAKRDHGDAAREGLEKAMKAQDQAADHSAILANLDAIIAGMGKK